MLSIQVDLSELNRELDAFGPSLMTGIRVGLKQCTVELIKESRKGLDEAFNISAHSPAPRAIQVDDSQTTPTSIVVGLNKATCPYAIYLHEGTKDHEIPLVKAKALHWVQGGESFFSKGHWVTGIKKVQFIYDAANKLKDKFSEIVRNAVEHAIKKESIE